MLDDPAAALTILVLALFELTFYKDWVSLLFWLLAGLAVGISPSRDAGAAPATG